MKKILFLLAGCTLYSCTATKDNRAVSRVIGSPALSNKVFTILEKQHPCVNDTVTKIIEGQEVTVYDTAYTDRTDTLFMDGKPTVVTKYKTILKTIRKVDTLRLTVEDTRRLSLCQSENDRLTGQIAEQNKQFDLLKKRSDKKTWWMVGLLAVIALLIFLRIKRV